MLPLNQTKYEILNSSQSKKSGKTYKQIHKNQNLKKIVTKNKNTYTKKDNFAFMSRN